MNPLAKIVKPDPQPAYVLLTIILTIFGVMLYRKAGPDLPAAVQRGFHVVALSFLTVAAILLVKFVRGLTIYPLSPRLCRSVSLARLMRK